MCVVVVRAACFCANQSERCSHALTKDQAPKKKKTVLVKLVAARVLSLRLLRRRRRAPRAVGGQQLGVRVQVGAVSCEVADGSQDAFVVLEVFFWGGRVPV